MKSKDEPIRISQFQLRNFLINRGLNLEGTTYGNRSLECLEISKVLARVSESGKGIDYTLTGYAQA